MFSSLFAGCRVAARATAPRCGAPRWNSSAAADAYTAIVAKFRVDLKKAMLAKDETKKNTIKSIILSIKNDEIQGNPKTEFELFRIYKSMIKQRAKSIENYASVDRDDLAQKERDEVAIISQYVAELPIASEDEVRHSIRALLRTHYPDGAGGPVPKTSEIMKLCDAAAAGWNTTPKIAKSFVNAEAAAYFKK
jgi:uncharacterized protein YqeY